MQAVWKLHSVLGHPSKSADGAYIIAQQACLATAASSEFAK